MVNGAPSGLSLVVSGFGLGEDLLEEQEYFLSYLQPSSPGEPSVIDLTNANFVDPLGLVGIAIFAEGQRRTGRDVTLHSPTKPTVATYISRMRLNGVLDYLGVEHNLPVVRGRPQNTLLELQRFEGERQAEKWAELIFDEFGPTNRPLADDLYTSVVELATNVPQHSGLPSGFVATQFFRDHALFAVGDAGSGFLATLAGVGALSEPMAVEMALHGTSGTGDTARGQGLPFVRDFVESRQGRLRIVTGRLSAVLHADRQVQYELFDPGLPGSVLLQVRVPR